MKFMILAILFLGPVYVSYSQDFSSPNNNNEKKNALEPSISLYNEFADVYPVSVEGYKKMTEKIDYPWWAQVSGAEGKVILLAYIDEYGEVKSVKIIKNIGFGCGEAAAKAISGSKFIPAVKDGKNINIKMAIPVTFQLYWQ